ncbi:PREDICTED: cyclin-dependent kinase inhibitor 1C-like [Ceratosolen solmsi marchali]|uniref:Cyclin-dependent kinase inhibitor 1C-like n=1 Tax=Ceratosolen solmsi marchali TaxID=326594 RepID=A0AAJ6VKH1_9HYME|nr:PREDICTED: cyclin-dependent kinase inhibitor 1C-like [Ceratosolen solmsi marchali]
MSARVLNPAMMTEMSRNLGVMVGSSGGVGVGVGVGRVTPSRAALARVRRELFGPVDHAAARALTERELRAQSMLDAERWGFDFRLEVPKSTGSSRFEWELVTAQDVVPEPYALRGMPYLRKHSPATPRKATKSARSPRNRRLSAEEETVAPRLPPPPLALATTTTLLTSERTPPQEARVPPIGERTPDVVPAIAELSFRSKDRNKKAAAPLREQPSSTPMLSHPRKQASITDFMKSRKRTLNSSGKSMLEPSEKVSRNAGQIRS